MPAWCAHTRLCCLACDAINELCKLSNSANTTKNKNGNQFCILHSSDWLLLANYWCWELFSPLILQREDRTVLSFQLVLCSADFTINALYSVLTNPLCYCVQQDKMFQNVQFYTCWFGKLAYLLTVSTCLRTVPSPKNKGFRASTRMRSKYDCQGRCGVPCYNKKSITMSNNIWQETL